MPKARDPNRNRAYEIYKGHAGKIDLVEIASQLNVSPGTVRGWKSKDRWEEQLNGTFPNHTERSKRRKGAQPNNHNALGHGAPLKNKNAEKHGFFSKYLPEETVSIMQEIDKKAPIDILWENIQISYAAIIRAQRIAFVKTQDDKTTEITGSSENGETYTIQQAWDKQNEFLKAQARAQSELRSLIKQYDEMLHSNWEQASDEQKARIEHLKAQTDKLTGNNQEIEDLDDVEADIYGGHKT